MYLAQASLIGGSLWGVQDLDQCPHLHHWAPVNEMPWVPASSYPQPVVICGKRPGAVKPTRRTGHSPPDPTTRSAGDVLLDLDLQDGSLQVGKGQEVLHGQLLDCHMCLPWQQRYASHMPVLLWPPTCLGRLVYPAPEQLMVLLLRLRVYQCDIIREEEGRSRSWRDWGSWCIYSCRWTSFCTWPSYSPLVSDCCSLL